MNKLSNLIFDKEYFELLDKPNITFDYLFIGKDPYPSNSNGIPFCKENFEELKKFNCSGKYLLNGLGVDIEDSAKNYENPKSLFLDLVKTKKIGFLNASYIHLKNHKLTDEELKEMFSMNAEIIKKSQNVYTSIGGCKILSKYLDVNVLNKIKKVCHPDVRNMNNRYKELHKEIWQTTSGLINSNQIQLL